MAVQNCTSSSGGEPLNHLCPQSILHLFKMKIAILLLLALVVISQQFYLRQPYSRAFWVSPYTSPHVANNYRPLIFITHEDFKPSFIPTDGGNHTDDDQNKFPDIQSRIRGFTSNRFSPPNNEGRFLIGGLGNNGLNYNGYYNTDKRFYKTFTTITTTTSTSLSTIFATSISTLVSVSTSTTISTSITSTTSTSTVVVSNTATLTLLASLVSCVPQFQVVLGAVACPAGRKKRQINDSEQFIIAPSETLELTTTALPSLDVEEQSTESDLPVEDEQKNVNALASSKDETHLNDGDNLRDKRFLNRYQFSTSTSTSLTTSTTTSTSVSTSTSIITVPTTSVTVSTSILTSLTTTTMTSFVFVNQTITQTANLINPAPTAQCAGDADGDGVVTPPECTPIACLPAGLVVCAAAAG
ncbi:hypothetical protein OUZ56_019810 [Daphnia magna]|uniref:Uncharacterized protein n=2 Tax=Daphnia magna TaxID=35525 RepID=A0ABQ9ZCP4_9CRUS|nr:hypothetical protein OUZ56_019810 [Daphnia magna]